MSSAGASSRARMLHRLFAERRLREDWFTPTFRARLPIARVQQIVRELTDSLGPYRSVHEDNDRWLVICEHGVIPAKLVIDEGAEQIAALMFRSPRLSFSDPGEALNALQTTPGQVGLLVTEGGRDVVASNPDLPLAVGSAFKLAVLRALRRQVESRKRSWTDVVELLPEHRSLASGILQDWPDRAPLTLYTLAALMMSRSDNTAADVITSVVGRRAVERYGSRNRPFLTTREMFALKDPANADLRMRYAAGDIRKRRAVISLVAARALPAADVFIGAPLSPDVEWFFTARELCKLMLHLADLPLTRINPGPADPAEWSAVSYKGGSDAGVLSFVHHLVTHDGRRYTVAAVWNDADRLDEARFLAVYNGLLGVLAADVSPARTPDGRHHRAGGSAGSRSGTGPPVPPASGLR
jgi:beta-lactamase class A